MLEHRFLRMLWKLETALSPTTLKLINDSHKHSSHYVKDGSSASDSGETHFRLQIVSNTFETMPMLKRHQLVYGLLDEELKSGVHALTMSTKTPEEANAK
ncbi:hypothetical protein CEUSTIGMA_g2809.t1 [Chlamydomonas eustigma]|uniref:BolA protein n=1 Tax=Chlamydomonas eustigma TaxID=1157962 RepID=A0A250WX51_9CHLO|nr:hypothetical protein CEUSTIGMA_g2809.t1 [Chlamydomonas eustigma]|eukprot:GAX75365.1 hypothetical protein CEUSTIGMA_g2809.t1 [Chlamydomonas eustigma]